MFNYQQFRFKISFCGRDNDENNETNKQIPTQTKDYTNKQSIKSTTKICHKDKDQNDTGNHFKLDERERKVRLRGSGCDTVGRAVTSYAENPGLTPPISNFIMNIFTVN